MSTGEFAKILNFYVTFTFETGHSKYIYQSMDGDVRYFSTLEIEKLLWLVVIESFIQPEY